MTDEMDLLKTTIDPTYSIGKNEKSEKNIIKKTKYNIYQKINFFKKEISLKI